jgi:isopenicillin-N epimerase
MPEPLSRRAFLRGAPVLGASALTLGGVKAAFAQQIRWTAEWKIDAGYWERIRNTFHLQKGLAYLNTGTVGATPGPVLEAMERYWRMMAENPNENSAILQSRVESIRAKAAQFIGADAAGLAILRNATEGNNLVCHGLDLARGDEVLIGTLEHDSNRQPWLAKARRSGIVVTQVRVGTPARTPQEIVDAFAAAISPRTRAISVAHCDTVTGTLVPLKEIAALARSRGILCCADGAQTVGMVQVNVEDLGVDTYATTSHKWLASPAGTGLLYVRKEIQDRIWPNIVTENWSTYTDARKYECVSRRPWPVVAALEDAIDFQRAIGVARIEQRVRELGHYFRSRAAEIRGVVLYTSNDARLSAGITSLGLEGVAPTRAREYLRQRHDIYTAARAKGDRYPADPHGVSGFRVSTHYYNTYDEIDRLLAGIKELAGTAS